MLVKAVVIAGISVLVGMLILASFSWFSKKPEKLGIQDGRLLPCPGTPNCVCSHDTNAVSGIEPLQFSDEPAAAWQRLQTILKGQPRCAIVTVEDDYLHAEFTSLIFRYVDDVEFQLDPEQKRIHLRSASRVGRSDLGVNRARMETIRSAFGG